MKTAARQSDANVELLGDSPLMAGLLNVIARAAPTNATVLIKGESGTGKELVARSIHQNSKRAGKAFIAINCAALPEGLVEAELFGYERNAFTGAETSKAGVFELADGGTLFLDEVAELSFHAQGKLLRALERREIWRIGATGATAIDVRLIAATSRDLFTEGFRHELYYRLNVIGIKTPALRHMPQDIPLLARHFIRVYAREAGRTAPDLSAEALAILVKHHWPGNVRELENVMERAIVLGSTDVILPEDLPADLLESPADGFNYAQAVKSFKREVIRQALEHADGDYKDAAAILAVHPTSLHKFIRNLGLKR